MKKIVFLFIALMLPLWVYSQAAQSTSESGKESASLSGGNLPYKPTLPVSEAIEKAETYLKERNADLSGQYIYSVQFYQDDGSRKGNYWRIQWAWSPAREEMELAVRIYMDGAVIPDLAGS